MFTTVTQLERVCVCVSVIPFSPTVGCSTLSLHEPDLDFASKAISSPMIRTGFQESELHFFFVFRCDYTYEH